MKNRIARSTPPLFDDMKALTTYLCFNSGEHLLDFMLGLYTEKPNRSTSQTWNRIGFGHNENCW